MDNLTHTLVGASLGRAGLDRWSELAMPTLLIAANLPDIDGVAALWGGLAYLEHHRGMTHSLVGVIAAAPLLAGAIVVYDRVVRQGTARFWPLVAVAACGLLSHPLLDYTNSYGIRPWLPFDSAWVYGDLAFIVDPWIWLLLGGAWVVATRRGRTLAAWLVCAVLVSALLLSSARVPGATKGLWCGLLLVVLIARWLRPRSPRAVARGALAGLLAYWGLLAVLHAQALSVAASSAPPGRLAVLPELGQPWRWRAVVETVDTLYVREVMLGGRDGKDWQAVPRHLDAVAASTVRDTEGARVMRGFARFLVAEVIDTAGRRAVLLRDLRFGPSAAGGFASVKVPLPPD